MSQIVGVSVQRSSGNENYARLVLITLVFYVDEFCWLGKVVSTSSMHLNLASSIVLRYFKSRRLACE